MMQISSGDSRSDESERRQDTDRSRENTIRSYSCLNRVWTERRGVRRLLVDPTTDISVQVTPILAETVENVHSFQVWEFPESRRRMHMRNSRKQKMFAFEPKKRKNPNCFIGQFPFRRPSRAPDLCLSVSFVGSYFKVSAFLLCCSV